MPVARRSDPQTSHDAARSVQELTRKQLHVLEIIKTFGPLTDEDIGLNYRRAARERMVEPQSDSGIRTRRNELQKMGLVEGVRITTNSTGRRVTVWDAARTLPTAPPADNEQMGLL
jgi:hypothetical protein